MEKDKLNENKNEINSEIFNDPSYKEIQIKKMIVNGKQQEGNIILAEDTKGKQEINVTVYTQETQKTPNKRKG